MLYSIPGLIAGLLVAGALSYADSTLHAKGRTSKRLNKHTFLAVGIVFWLAWTLGNIALGAEIVWGHVPLTCGFFIAWLGLSIMRTPGKKLDPTKRVKNDSD